MSNCPIFIVDAFTTTAFRGNAAAVCLLPEERPADWMQRVAAEMNLSETAFVRREGAAWALRWFTPTVEVPLCGHATLATAFALWTEAEIDDPDLVFSTHSGRLTAAREGERIRLDFPARTLTPADPPGEVLAAIRVAPLSSHRVDVDGETPMWVLELPEAQLVRDLDPRLVGLRRPTAPSFCVTAAADDGVHDFVSRFFAPGHGIDEDPVTGSAHCALGPLWRERLGKDELLGHQVSTRGGVVGVRVLGERVHLLGDAVCVLRGTLAI